MRYLKLLYISVVLAITGVSNAQTGLTIDNQQFFFSDDSLYSGSALQYSTTTYNAFSSSATFTGTITYFTGIDTVGNGGLIPADIDTLRIDTTNTITLIPGDSTNFTDSVVLTIGLNCRGGINTVVIWPVASDIMFPTLDSIRHDVLVLETTSLKSAAQKEIIRVGPNPFSERIDIIYPGKNSVEQVRIVDMNGKVVFENKAGSRPYIETAMLSKGVYFVEVTFADGSKTRIKTIKQ